MQGAPGGARWWLSQEAQSGTCRWLEVLLPGINKARSLLGGYGATTMLTARDVADQLRISARKVYALAASGHLASHRFGSAVRFSQADVDTYVQSCRCPVSADVTRPGSLAAFVRPHAEHPLAAYFANARGARRR